MPEHEAVIDPAQATAAAAAANIAVVAVEDVGHGIVLEKPDVTIKILATLLLS